MESKSNQDKTEDIKEECCKIGPTSRRYIALIYLLLLAFGLLFTYDIPGSLQHAIMKHFELNAYEFSYLYSISSWPNVILCFFSGFLIDRIFGVKLGTVIYSGVATLGLALFALGGMIEIFPLMLLGRFIFGIGCESLAICMNYYLILWFSGKELNTMFATVFNLGRIGSSVVYQVATPFFNHLSSFNSQGQSLGIALVVMCSPTFLTLISSLFLACLKSKKKEESERSDGKDPTEGVVRLKDVLTFPLQFWLLCLSANNYIVVVFSFLALSQDNLAEKYNISIEKANHLISFFNIVTAILSPLLGFWVDKRGRNLRFVTLAVVTGIFSHALIAYSKTNAYIVMCMFAVSFAFILSSVWPMFSMTVKNHQTGTAYGVVQAVMNGLFSVGTLIAGWIIDKYDFFALEMFYLVSLLVCLIMTIGVWVLDKRNDGILNMTVEDRKYYEKRTQALSQMTLDKTSSVSTSIAQSLGNVSSLTIPSTNADFKS